MQRIRVYACGDPEVMTLEDAPDPIPEAGQVLVRLHAVGVNPVETYLRSGRQGYAPKLPYTPGTDAAGAIEVVGPDVTGLNVGDRVYCGGTLSGAYAEKAVCAQAQVHPLPAHVSFAQGAAVNIPYVTAYRALFHKANARPGEIVLVHGASGGVGIAAVQLAAAAGMAVIGTVGAERGAQLVREQGAHDVVNHKQPDQAQQIMDMTHGQGVDVILEMLANVNLGQDLPLLAKNGRVVVIGSRGDAQITPRDLMGRDAAIFGMTMMNASPAELKSIHAFLAAGLAHGTLRPVVGQELPLQEAAQAHHLVMEASAYGKIVLIP